MATILLADDHAPTRKLLAERLSADGFSVLSAVDANDAYERLATSSPDIVLSSIALPPAEGKHLLKRIHEAKIGIPLVVYDTGHRPPLHGIRAVLELGANGYLEDPTRHEALHEKLTTLLTARAESGTAPKRTADRKPLPQEECGTGPAEEDALDEGAVARLLLSAWRSQLTATLELEHEGEKHSIHLTGGLPSGVSSSDPKLCLPRWMLARGMMEENTTAEVLDVSARDSLSLSAALVEAGVVEPGDKLVELLREHMHDLLTSWIGIQSGKHRILQSVSHTGPSLAINPLPLVRKAAESHHPAGIWLSCIGNRIDQYPHRTDAFGEHLDDLALSPAEITLALKISGQVTAREMLVGCGGDLKQALLMLWFLDQTGAVRFSRTPIECSEADVYRARVAPTRKKKPLPAEQADQLREEALQIITASYYGVLGVDITADIEEIERAYHHLANRFHPESWDAYDLTELEDLFQTVLHRASAAYRVLSSEERRKAYLAFLLSRQQTSLRRGKIMAEAEVALRKGIELIKEGDAAGASEAFQEAHDINPKEPAYLAHLALATFNAGHGPPDARAKRPRKLLKKALSMEPGHEQANLVAALIEESCGRRDVARTHALTVLRQNPRSETGKALLQRINRTS